jgi:hypothetical protein
MTEIVVQVEDTGGSLRFDITQRAGNPSELERAAAEGVTSRLKEYFEGMGKIVGNYTAVEKRRLPDNPEPPPRFTQ